MSVINILIHGRKIAESNYGMVIYKKRRGKNTVVKQENPKIE